MARLTPSKRRKRQTLTPPPGGVEAPNERSVKAIYDAFRDNPIQGCGVSAAWAPQMMAPPLLLGGSDDKAAAWNRLRARAAMLMLEVHFVFMLCALKACAAVFVGVVAFWAGGGCPRSTVVQAAAAAAIIVCVAVVGACIADCALYARPPAVNICGPNGKPDQESWYKELPQKTVSVAFGPHRGEELDSTAEKLWEMLDRVGLPRPDTAEQADYEGQMKYLDIIMNNLSACPDDAFARLAATLGQANSIKYGTNPAHGARESPPSARAPTRPTLIV